MHDRQVFFVWKVNEKCLSVHPKNECVFVFGNGRGQCRDGNDSWIFRRFSYQLFLCRKSAHVRVSSKTESVFETYTRDISMWILQVRERVMANTSGYDGWYADGSSMGADADAPMIWKLQTEQIWSRVKFWQLLSILIGVV